LGKKDIEVFRQLIFYLEHSVTITTARTWYTFIRIAKFQHFTGTIHAKQPG